MLFLLKRVRVAVCLKGKAAIYSSGAKVDFSRRDSLSKKDLTPSRSRC